MAALRFLKEFGANPRNVSIGRGELYWAVFKRVWSIHKVLKFIGKELINSMKS
jgi:hypothetical protein